MASTHEDTRTPEEIERDIERTRSQMAGTLNDLQQRLSSGHLVDQALGYIDEKAGRWGAEANRMSAEVMHTVRDNPIPITLMGVGLAWLLFGGRSSGESVGETQRSWGSGSSRSPGGSQWKSYRSGIMGSASTGGSQMPEHAMGERAFTERRLGGDRRENPRAGMEAYRSFGEGMGGGHAGSMRGESGGMEQSVKSKGRELGERMNQGIEEAKGTASEMAGTVREKAEQTGGQIRQKVGETVGQAREKTMEITGQAREKASELTHRVQDQTRHVIEEQPLVVAALGIALGAAIGASLPRTRREDELMGGTRDELKQRAEQTGAEMLHEVREQVHSVAEEARESGRPEGEVRSDNERAETSPITAGSSAGTLGRDIEREGQTSGTIGGTTGGTGWGSPGGSRSGSLPENAGERDVTQRGDLAGGGERVPTTSEDISDESRRNR